MSGMDERPQVVRPQERQPKARWGVVVIALLMLVGIAIFLAKENCEEEGKTWFWLPVPGGYWGCEVTDD